MKSRWLVGAILLAVFVCFQNCSIGTSPIGRANSHQSKSLFSGNGGGYDGKVTVYTKEPKTMTCADGSAVEARVEVLPSGEAFITRENCVDQAPQQVTLAAINLMEHNPRNVMYNGSLFDLEEKADGRSSILCRGDSVDPVSSERRVVDAVVREEMTGGVIRYFGRVILGIYSPNGTLSRTYDMGEVPLDNPDVGMPGLEVYRSQTGAMDEAFLLQVRLDDNVGMLSYIGNLPAPGQPLGPENDRQIVRRLSCYRQ